MITADILHNICGLTNAEMPKFVDPLNKTIAMCNINTKKRQAAFLSQVIVESGFFVHTSENLNYSAQGLLLTFPKHFSKAEVASFAHQPEKIANRAYANRGGNGNEASGDGWMYRGRGLIGITFKDSYQQLATWLKMPLADTIAYMETPEGAAISAGWFWTSRNLNLVADTGNIKKVSECVNGGDNGLADRTKYYKQALVVLG